MYPPGRKIYSQEVSFNLCPTGHCQDREMYIQAIDDNSPYKCDNIKFYLKPNNSQITLWTNFKIGTYQGIAITLVPDYQDNLLGSAYDPILAGIILSDNKKYEFTIKLFDSIHKDILNSFEAR